MEVLLAAATIIGAFAAIWFFWDKIAPVFRKRPLAEREIASFIRQGQALRARSGEDPLPVAEHNDWVARMVSYLRSHGALGYETRLSDFSGMTFYCDGSERSKYSNAIDGRLRRLHEFMGELHERR